MKIPKTQNILPLPIVIWVIAVAMLVGLPFQILSTGFLPPDDALRYAAKAVSGKAWSEIVIIRPEITIDANLGWNWLLAMAYRATDWNPRQLVAFSVVTMFVVFAVWPMAWLKRPETWLISLALVMVVFPYFPPRAFTGRPLFMTMAVTLIILSLWTRSEERRVSTKVMVVSTALMALATWVHGSWYLLVLLPLVFFLARAWEKGLLLTICWIAGVVLGALGTGEPVEFLSQTALIPFLALGQSAPLNSLQGEFQPFTGGWPAAVVAGVVVLWRTFSGRPLAPLLRDPVLWLAVIGWLLGFRVLRFWLDWGIPALTLWLARQFDEILEQHLVQDWWKRVAVIAVAAFVLLGIVASDRNARWSQYGKFDALNANRPDHVGWLPEPGGILYCVNQSVFYETFFSNPYGNWRYILGFEPSFMRPEDHAVYAELWETLNAVKALTPWVQRMTLADRLVLVSGPEPKPTIPGLEWHYAANNTWVGRLSR